MHDDHEALLRLIVLTVRGNCANAKISAVLSYISTTLLAATSQGELTGVVKANSTTLTSCLVTVL